MTILFYISNILGGGAARVMTNLANTLSQDAKCRIILVTNFSVCKGKSEYPLSDKVLRKSIEQEENKSCGFKKNYARIISLRKIVKEEKPDVVVSFMAENCIRALMATAFLGVKNVISIRNVPEIEVGRGVKGRILRAILSTVDGFVFQTEEAKSWFSKSVQNKSRVIPNHVADKFFEIERSENQEGMAAVGRLTKQKNYPMLLKAFASVSEKFSDKLYIYGDGELKDELCLLCKELDISERVVFEGNVSDIENRLSHHRAFIMTSDYEGMPNALMEALCAGCACISTDCPCGGPKYLIEDGINGLLVPVGDVEKTAEAIKRVMTEEELCRALSENARNRAEMFKSERVFGLWREYISHVANKK